MMLRLLLLVSISFAAAADQPQWGAAWSRNMVSTEKGLAEKFDVKSGENVRWRAQIGTETHSTPVVSGGRILIGTNNGRPRDSKHDGDRGVLICFDEKTGAFLWQLVVPKRVEDQYFDWPRIGLCSPATVEGDRVYVMTNRHEVACLDLHGMKNGNDGPFKVEGRHMTPAELPALEPGATDADILWIVDLVKDAGIWAHDGAHSSILIHGPHLYVNTGTGVDNTHKRIRTPDAPGLIVMDKATGKILAREHEGIAPNTFHACWSSPSLAEVAGKARLFYCGGNGLLYAFEPLAKDAAPDSLQPLKKLWQYDPDPAAPKTDVHVYSQNRQEGPSSIHGMPVFHDGRLYFAGGGDVWWGKNESWLQCVDAAKGTKLWSLPLGKHVMSTPAVQGDLCFIADTDRVVRCVNAKSGREFWQHSTEGDYWASPLIADGKVYIGSRRGDFWVFAASAEKKVIFKTHLGAPITATVCAANGTLYVATMTDLFAVAVKAAAQ
jgi:outer membrane protein assembly factor BamB